MGRQEFGTRGAHCNAARPRVDGLAPPAPLGRPGSPTQAQLPSLENLTPGQGATLRSFRCYQRIRGVSA